MCGWGGGRRREGREWEGEGGGGRGGGGMGLLLSSLGGLIHFVPRIVSFSQTPNEIVHSLLLTKKNYLHIFLLHKIKTLIFPFKEC